MRKRRAASPSARGTTPATAPDEFSDPAALEADERALQAEMLWEADPGRQLALLAADAAPTAAALAARNDAPNADRQAHTLADAATLIQAAARGGTLPASPTATPTRSTAPSSPARASASAASSAARTPTTWCFASTGPACYPHRPPTRRSRTRAASRCIRRHRAPC